MEKVLAFDQSTTKSGWCVFIGGTYDHSGVIDKHKNKDIHSRFKEMYEGIHDIIEAEKPSIVVIEDTQSQAGNWATYKVLCQLQGAIIGMCYAMGIRLHIIAPTQWRAALHYAQGPKVKRAELKQQSIEFAKREFGIDRCEDEMEACCINAGFHRIKSRDIEI